MAPPIPDATRPTDAWRTSRAARLGACLALPLLSLALLSCDGPVGTACDGMLSRFTTPITEITLPRGESRQLTLTLRTACPGTPVFALGINGDGPGNGDIGFSASLNPASIAGDGATTTMTLTADFRADGLRVILLEVYGEVPDGPGYGLEPLFIRVIVPEETGEETCGPWAEVESHRGPYQDVSFGNSTPVGYVTTGGTAPTILKSTDAGRTWAPLPSVPPLEPGSYFGQVYFGDDIYEDVGVVSVATTGFATALYRTEDGGTSWQQVSSWSGGAVHEILHLNDTQSFIAGTALWGSQDNGVTWVQIPTPVLGTLSDIAYATTDRLALSGRSGGLAYSSNGGGTWQLASAPGGAYNWVDFFDSENGVAGGSILARTGDGGVTWQQSTDFSIEHFGGSAQRTLSSGTVAYTVGAQLIWETRDAGVSWQLACTGSGVFSEVATIDAESGGGAVAVGSTAIWRRN
jgi:photosystem II stability/assembly factor-like uncharacterized protein